MESKGLMLKLLLLLVFSFFFSISKAAEGCLIGANIYPGRANAFITANLLSSGVNAFNANTTIPTNNCISGTIAGSCYVCHGTLDAGIGIGGVYVLVCTSGLGTGRIDTGTYYSNYVLECDLDSYSFLMVLALAGFGAMKINKVSGNN